MAQKDVSSQGWNVCGVSKFEFGIHVTSKSSQTASLLGEVDNPNPGKHQVSNSRLFGNV